MKTILLTLSTFAYDNPEGLWFVCEAYVRKWFRGKSPEHVRIVYSKRKFKNSRRVEAAPVRPNVEFRHVLLGNSRKRVTVHEHVHQLLTQLGRPMYFRIDKA